MLLIQRLFAYCGLVGALAVPVVAAGVSSPSIVRFVYSTGGNAPEPQALRIDLGPGTSYTLTHPNSAWVGVSPASGTGSGTHQVTVHAAQLSQGVHRTDLVVSTPAGMARIPVHVAVFNPATPGQVFQDIAASHPWADYIYLLAQFGITIGCSASPPAYCPGGTVTQDQMAAFIVRGLEGEDFPHSINPYFSDTGPDNVLFKYVQRAKELGINTGCELNRFCPGGFVTRGQTAAFIIRALYGENFPYSPTPRFADVPATGTYFKYIQKLYEIGVTQGCTESQFCPNTLVNREQMSAFLNRAFFRYRVLNNGVPSAPASPLPAPAGFTATPGNGAVTLSWNAVTGANAYAIYRGLTPNEGGSPVAMVNGTTVTHTGLVNGTKYYFQVAAVNGAGPGAKSNEISATPSASPSPGPNPTPTPPPPTPPPTNPVVDLLTAWRFLRQSSFGPTESTINQVRTIGIEAFLNQQFDATPSTYPDTLLDKPSVEWVQEYFFRNTLLGQDQLRQRVAFALSQLMVVSAVEVDCAEAMTRYLRILHDGAFGNFYDLLRNVTLSVAMGEYLDMVNNKKAADGFMPNENFGREVMQLFTIGLVKLNQDGTPQLDNQGQPIPSYDQDTVADLTRALTGWTYPDNRAGNPTRLNTEPRYHAPMEPVESAHDNGAKTVLGVTIPAGQTATQDLDQALGILFNHPNVGPFVSRHLIQRLVTSDPSPAYVGAVAAVFNNNGSGVRGDLRAVVKAILLHPEARQGRKLMEPALYVAGVVRALNATVADHPFMTDLAAEMGQRVFYSPSVFNYFSPGYRIPNYGIAGPEFQIFTTATVLTRANFAAKVLNSSFGGDLTFSFDPYTALVTDQDALIDKVGSVFLGGRIPAELRTAVKESIAASTSNRERARSALYLILASPLHQVDY